MWFWFRELLYCVCASEYDAYVRLFEEDCQRYPWAVIRQDCQFSGFVFLFVLLSRVRCVFCCICDFCCVIILSGKLLLCVIAFIVLHSVFLSFCC